MGLSKSHGHKRSRAEKQLGRPSKGTHDSGQAPVDRQSSDAPASAIEQPLEPNPDVSDKDDVELADLSPLLEQFVADANRESSAPPETLFELVDDPIGVHRPGAVDEAVETRIKLVDLSKWFEYNDPDSVDDDKEQQTTLSEEGSPEECSSDFSHPNTPETEPGNTISKGHYSSLASVADGNGEYVVESSSDQATVYSQHERRRDQREASSDLVWVEYFDSSMVCMGKEAARAENFSAGGMRVCVKAAPPELERLIVSYSYRGFESCSIVRSRYRDDYGQEHLCLEFVDREWKANAKAAPAENAVNETNPRRILLADDDAAFRKILGNILVRAGYEVILAEDGERAVEKATSERPDLVITDGLMPKLHGFQVCKAVKELSPQPRVIMLTAVYTSPNQMWEAKSKFGADDIITKPCQIGDLLRKIEEQISLSSNPRIAEPRVGQS